MIRFVSLAKLINLFTNYRSGQSDIESSKDTVSSACLKAGKDPPENYQNFQKFIQNVQSGDKIRGVFVEQ